MGERTSNGGLKEFVNRLRIMEAYHWDYLTLLKQPAWVIENIKGYLSAQSEVQSKKDGTTK